MEEIKKIEIRYLANKHERIVSESLTLSCSIRECSAELYAKHGLNNYSLKHKLNMMCDGYTIIQDTAKSVEEKIEKLLTEFFTKEG